MTLKSFNISLINSAEIVSCNESVYSGWTDAELSNYKTSYQAAFLGRSEDIVLQITCNDGQTYYAIFRSGESFKQQRQFLLIENTCFVIVNANGNIYRFDVAARQSLDVDCYANIQFNSPYLTSHVSNKPSVMTIVDSEGIAVINWNGVLWKKNFEYARADYLKVTTITQKYILLEYQSPEYGTQCIKLNTSTGAVIHQS